MTDPEQTETEGEWLLAGQIPQEGAAPAIEGLRPLTSGELESLEQASELLGRLSAASEYARAVGLMRALEERHAAICGRDRPPPAAALGPLAETIDAVCVALREIPATLIEQAQRDLAEKDAESLNEEITAITTVDYWRAAVALPAVTGDRRANLVVDDGRLRLTDAGLAALGSAADEADVGDQPVIEIVAQALLRAQEMIAQRILAYHELIDEHGLFVRLLAAEVQLGHPIALAVGPAQDRPVEESRTMSLKPLPLDRVAILQAAIRNAESLLAEGESLEDEDEDEDDDEDDDDEAEADDEADEDTEAGGPPGPLPLDYQLLIEHARQLPGEVERAWSAALDAVGQAEAHAELAARWTAVLTATARLAQQQSLELAEAGVDGRMPLPDDPAVLSVLELDGDARAAWLAGSIGQMGALQAVAAGYRQIMEADADSVRFREPDDPKWWDSGAFAALRSRAFALERLSAEVDAAQARLLGTQDPSDPPPGVPVTGSWSHRLHLADDASVRGDWEAAVVHLWLALRERAAQLAGVEVASISINFEEHLASDPEVAGFGHGIVMLAGVARRILAGSPPPLGLSVALAGILSGAIRRLCSSLSNVLIDAVGGGGGETSNPS